MNRTNVRGCLSSTYRYPGETPIFREDGTYIDGFDWRDKRADFEPFVVFNENEASWSNPLGQISGILSHGFYSVMRSNLVKWVTLIFFLPVSAVAIFLLLIYMTRNIIPYLLVIGSSALLPYSSAILSYEGPALAILPIILLCGIYLRILNLILFGRSRSFYEIRYIWKKVYTRIHHV